MRKTLLAKLLRMCGNILGFSIVCSIAIVPVVWAAHAGHAGAVTTPEPRFYVLTWPIAGHISSRFGYRADPMTGQRAFHPGMDIVSKYGDAVVASADGVVAIAGRRIGYGRLVVIDHGSGVTTWYAHLSRLTARKGAPVHAGDVVGYEGRSGRSTGTHLHYEIRIRNSPVNPWRYLRVLGPEQIARSSRPVLHTPSMRSTSAVNGN